MSIIYSKYATVVIYTPRGRGYCSKNSSTGTNYTATTKYVANFLKSNATITWLNNNLFVVD
jgi:hypothetical protein